MPDDGPTQEKILKEYPRLGPDDAFPFRCGKDLDCFTCCCQDVSIVLTPYDVLRMKRSLGISSSEFLEKYTQIPIQKDQKFPAVMFKMNHEKEKKPCQLVSEKGCEPDPALHSFS